MNRHKTILLPDDDRILRMRLDPDTEEEDKRVWRRRQRKRKVIYRVTRLLFLLVFLVPILFIVVTFIIRAIAVKIWKGEEAAHAQVDRMGMWLEFLERFYPPGRDYGYLPYFNKSRFREDVPGFISKARKFGYRLLVYSFNQEVLADEAWNNLVREGVIDGLLHFEDEAALFSRLGSPDIDREHSRLIGNRMWRDASSAPSDSIIVSLEDHDDSKFTVCPSFNKCGDRIMFSRIRLPYNSLLDETVVFYFEHQHSPQWNAYMHAHYDALSAELAAKGLRLLYFPVLNSRAFETPVYEGLLRYLYPDKFMGEAPLTPGHLAQWIGGLDVSSLYALFAKSLSIPYSPVPCLLHCVELTQGLSGVGKATYSCMPLWSNEESAMRQEIGYFLGHVRKPDNKVYFSLADGMDEEYDADGLFDQEGARVSPEVLARIREIRDATPEAKMLSTIFHFIQAFRDMDPELSRKLNRELFDAFPSLSNRQSRVYIDRQFRIFLSDYGNIEIEMTPLPKTLFLFMLKYPDGILFKELHRHKQELMYIYGRIGNRTDVEQMQKSINDMTDARSNSVNEKSSRIKEAFLSKIDERVASAYFITGNRHEPKRITLDRSLVSFEEAL